MKQITYIGIRGHRGSGKNTVAYLLANTIQYLLDKCEDDMFDLHWNIWCDRIIDNEQNALNNLDTYNVYLESFGFMPKMLVELITNIPHDYIESDYHKDHLFINVRTLDWKIVDDLKDKPMTVDLNAFRNHMHTFRGDMSAYTREPFMSLRDFIVYFANTCMSALGQDIWVKSVRNNELREDENDVYNIGPRFKIFKDIKAPSELTYIKEKNGIVIKVIRPGNMKKNQGVELLKDDDRWDFEIENTDIRNDQNFRSKIVDIAKYVIENHEK